MGKGVNIKQFKAHRDAAKFCYYCERPFGNTGMDCCGKKTVDHVIAIAKGGYNDETNIVISCDWCNNQKGDLSLALFEAKMGTLTEMDLMGINADIVQFNVRHLIFLSKRKQGLYRNNHPFKRVTKKTAHIRKKEPGADIFKEMDRKIKNTHPHKITENSQHVIICEYAWGGVPVDTVWAKNSLLYNEMKDKLVASGIIHSDKHLPLKITPVGIPTFKRNELTHHEWVHRYNLEPQINFHYED